MVGLASPGPLVRGVCAVPEVRESPVDDLRVLHDEPPVQVVLAGLPPIYRHGLAAGFTAAGMVSTALTSMAELPALLVQLTALIAQGAGGFVVIVASSEVPALTTVLGETQIGDVPLVHVVDDATAEVCAEALRVGATGVIALDAELNQVIGVVRAAAGGQTLLPRQVARSLCRSQVGPVPQLLPRERDWLRHLADCGTVAGLARTVGYSEREMYRLLGGVYARLGASNRTEALLLAERWGLLEGDSR
jgi:DNA-binding NarL/FixJ family response regulator